MNFTFVLHGKSLESRAFLPFELYRDKIRPVLEGRRKELGMMYAPVMGRPEIDPVLLMGVMLLQLLERLTDRRAVDACLFDVRWRAALGIAEDWAGINPSTLCYFRERLQRQGQAKIIFDAALKAMSDAGYFKGRGNVRIDSTHMLANISRMSRLECVREALRLALEFLVEFGGGWEPWSSRYFERNPDELRGAGVEKFKAAMQQAGCDMRDIIARTEGMGEAVCGSKPVALLRRVFEEQFEFAADMPPVERKAPPPGAVQNPHDPDAQWSTKLSMGKTGWVGYKIQICETAPDQNCAKGEPTQAVITAVITQPATTSDHGSAQTVLQAHLDNGNRLPQTVFADAGYVSAPAIEKAAAEGYDICGPIASSPHSNRFGSEDFIVDLPNRAAICPAKKTNSQCSKIKDKNKGRTSYYFAWDESDCSACPLKDKCLSKKTSSRFRTLEVSEKHMTLQARRDLCKTEPYKILMKRRNGIEGTNSECKRGYGLGKARYRGKRKTELQTIFTAAACNLRRWSARIFWLSSKSSKNTGITN